MQWSRVLAGFTMAALLVVGVPMPTVATPAVRPGIDVLVGQQRTLLSGKRVGLISNPTGITAAGVSDVEAMLQAGINLTALFAPEHGWRAGAAAGAKVDDTVDAATGLPIYSLYGNTRKPTPAMLRNLDVLVFDIQDVGARYYTYVSTMAYAMEAAQEAGIPFMVLDRPNPIGGLGVEGPKLDVRYSSFVGLYPIPISHGLTIGELARLINQEFGIGAKLTVVPMQGWRRSMWFDQTGLPWVAPSPNMRTLATAIVYPGTCLIEGTNVSEGRGTDAPFEQIGASWIKGSELADYLNARQLPGVRFVSVTFQPDSSKFAGKQVQGVKLVVTDRQTFKAVQTGVHLLAALQRLYPRDFQWLKTGSSYNVDRLWGSDRLRTGLGNGMAPADLAAEWENDVQAFRAMRTKYLLYE